MHLICSHVHKLMHICSSKQSVCHVYAGQMLYLPAGWFHCVTSQSTPGGSSHLAFNYWFHPPDNLDPGLQGFERPYISTYWPLMWRRRLQGMAKGPEQDADAFMSDDGNGLIEPNVVGLHDHQSSDHLTERPVSTSGLRDGGQLHCAECANSGKTHTHGNRHAKNMTPEVSNARKRKLSLHCPHMHGSQQSGPDLHPQQSRKHAKLMLLGLGRRHNLQCFA